LTPNRLQDKKISLDGVASGNSRQQSSVLSQPT